MSGADRLIVVDAIDRDAFELHRHHDFHPINGIDEHLSGRLVMKVATARKALVIGTVRFTASPELRLGSIVLRDADGKQFPVVVSVAELAAAGPPQSMQINLNEVLVEVLGRGSLRGRP